MNLENLLKTISHLFFFENKMIFEKLWVYNTVEMYKIVIEVIGECETNEKFVLNGSHQEYIDYQFHVFLERFLSGENISLNVTYNTPSEIGLNLKITVNKIHECEFLNFGLKSKNIPRTMNNAKDKILKILYMNTLLKKGITKTDLTHKTRTIDSAQRDNILRELEKENKIFSKIRKLPNCKKSVIEYFSNEIQ